MDDVSLLSITQHETNRVTPSIEEVHNTEEIACV